MLSQLHEALLLLFRNRPTLAPELLRDALHVELPPFTEARIDSAELTDIQPAEYRADLVILLLDGVPVLGIVIEAQLASDERKRFVWPVYVANLRARFEVALADPELAVLSAMAHGRDVDGQKAARIALAAQIASLGLDDDRARLYFDLVLNSLSDAAKSELRTMDPAKYEFQSDFAKKYIAIGRQEGNLEGQLKGQADLLTRLLTRRFGALPPDAAARIAAAASDELDAIGDRLLTAQSLEEALGPA